MKIASLGLVKKSTKFRRYVIPNGAWRYYFDDSLVKNIREKGRIKK